MKVCIVNSFYFPDIIGGAESIIMKLCEGMYKKGYDVHVLCTGNKNCIDNINGIIVHRIKIKNICSALDFCTNSMKINKLEKNLYSIIDRFNILNYKIIKNELIKINPDIIHTNNLYGISVIVWSIAKRLKIPVLHTIHDYDLLCSKKDFVHQIKRNMNRKFSLNVNMFTTPSEYVLNVFLKNNFFLNIPHAVINNSIDFSEHEINENLKNKLEKKGDSKTRFIFLGRLTEKKGIMFLLKAFIKIQNPDIELLIAGKGEKEYEINKYTNLDSRIKYLGFLNEIQKNKLLNECDVLVIPSLWSEPFGMVILEAYKYGIPVIATRVGGIPELVNDNVTGKLIDKDNEHELIKSILFLTNRNNIFILAKNCIEKVKKYYIEDKCEEFIKCYKNLLRGKKNE